MTKRKALLIGNGQFPEEELLADLDGPRQDVEELARVLGDQAIGRFATTELIDCESYTILPAIDEFLANAEQDDLCLLAFSGHGKLSIRGHLCLATRNTRLSALQSTSIPIYLLRALLDGSRCKRIILLFDCCYSGAAAKAFLRSTVDDQLKNVKGEGTFILTSSTALETSVEQYRQHDGRTMGEFSAAVVEGLESGRADVDGDGLITLSDLSSYLNSNLALRRPQLWGFEASGDIVIARSPILRPAELPTDLRLAIDSRFPSIQEGALLELAKLSTGNHLGLQAAARTALADLCSNDSRRISALARQHIANLKLQGIWGLPEHTPIEEPKAVLASGEGTPVGRLASRPKMLSLSLDTWPGWRSLLWCNGGLTTSRQSSLGKQGHLLQLELCDDPEKAVTRLIDGSLDGLGITVNRYAHILPRLRAKGIETKMLLITNASTGADGVICRDESMTTVDDLRNVVVAAPAWSEALCLLMWCTLHSGLSSEERRRLVSRAAMPKEPSEAARLFLNGDVSAVALWEPFLSRVREASNGALLLSTRSVRNFILDGIVVRLEALEAHRKTLHELAKAHFEIADRNSEVSPSEEEMAIVRNHFPGFGVLSREQMLAGFGGSSLLSRTENADLFEPSDGVASYVFEQSARVWRMLGDAEADPALAAVAFTTEILSEIKAESYARPRARGIPDRMSASDCIPLVAPIVVEFLPGLNTLVAAATEKLRNLTEMARVASGTLIEITGYFSTGPATEQNLKSLAWKRARTVATLLEYDGLDPRRLVVNVDSYTGPHLPDSNESVAISLRAP